MNLSYLYLKKILEEELRDHDCQCQLNADFTVTISCRVDGTRGALYIVPNCDFLQSSSFSDLSAFILEPARGNPSLRRTRGRVEDRNRLSAAPFPSRACAGRQGCW